MSASRAIERKLLTHILVALLVPTETILAADAPKQSAAPNAQDSTSLPNEQLDSASCRLSQTATVSITTQEAKIVFDRSGNLRFVGELDLWRVRASLRSGLQNGGGPFIGPPGRGGIFRKATKG
jgi:hypothetical protein